MGWEKPGGVRWGVMRAGVSRLSAHSEQVGSGAYRIPTLLRNESGLQ